MSSSWQSQLSHNAMDFLDSIDNPAVHFLVKRDLLDGVHGSSERIWELKEVQKILRRQQGDGRWKYPGGNHKVRSSQDYDQLETYRQLGYLVEKYGFERSHPAITAAAEFLFGFQTTEGDFRGIYGTQYTANYTAGILELLIKAGYDEDPRVQRCFDWLEAVRQNDGGWTIPIRSHARKFDRGIMEEEVLPFVQNAPSSHLVTGVVLRAFAAHGRLRRSTTAQTAGVWLADRLLTRDTYHDRQSVETWYKITFPFWFTDVVSALDSLSSISLPNDHPRIALSLDWLREAQMPDGSWRLKMLRSGNDPRIYDWLTLAICRIFKRFFQQDVKF